MRADMVSLLSGQGLRISRFEFDHNKKSRTIDTMRLLKKQYPNDTFSFIIGSDTLPTFRLWNEWNSLVHDYNLIVFPRDTDLQTLEERVKLSFDIFKYFNYQRRCDSE